MVDIKILKGNDVSSGLFKEIAKIVTAAFVWDEPLTKDFVKDNIIFIGYVNNKIVAVGWLRPDKVTFCNKKYDIMGVADIVSVEKGKGYGKALMNSITKYLKDNNSLGVGLCSRKNSEFYEKCGFTILKDSAKIFQFNGLESDDGDVLYYNDVKGLLKLALSYPEEKIKSECETW